MSKKPPHKQKQKKFFKHSSDNFSNFNSNSGQNNLNLTAILDLHFGPRNLEEVSLLVDRFLVQERIKNLHLIRKNGQIQLGIIVGTGNNSKRLINGKNPLRHFVESYLAQTDITWQDNLTNFQNSGLIVVELE